MTQTFGASLAIVYLADGGVIMKRIAQMALMNLIVLMMNTEHVLRMNSLVTMENVFIYLNGVMDTLTVILMIKQTKDFVS